MGKKCIIELEDVPFFQYYNNKLKLKEDSILYRVKGFNSLVFDSEGLKRLTPYTEPDKDALDAAYAHGYSDAESELHKAEKYCDECPDKKIVYEKGLNAAFDAITRVCNMANDYRMAMFGTESFLEILGMRERILEKFAAYEERKKQKEEILAGDEVIGDDMKAVVVNLNPTGTQVQVLTADGKVSWWTKNAIHKTGRHFSEIAEVLKKMREQE